MIPRPISSAPTVGRGRRVTLVGSVKWLEQRPFDVHDLGRLLTVRSRVPGAADSTPVLAVSRSGSAIDPEVPVLAPEDLLAAYRDAS